MVDPLERRTTGTAALADDDQTVEIGTTSVGVTIHVPKNPWGAVLFVHGSGVTRHAPSNEFVAARLARAGMCTVLVDLLTEIEARDRHNAFDAEMQADRLVDVWTHLRDQFGKPLPLAYYGTGIGASVVLEAATRTPHRVSAIVVRAARPDLAMFWPGRVTPPTLFIVQEGAIGERACAEAARRHMRGEVQLVIAPSPQDNEAAASVASYCERWYARYLKATLPAPPAQHPSAHAFEPGNRKHHRGALRG
jgi:pimeloyl-ACP methyl ester carboxylesterase